MRFTFLAVVEDAVAKRGVPASKAAAPARTAAWMNSRRAVECPTLAVSVMGLLMAAGSLEIGMCLEGSRVVNAGAVRKGWPPPAGAGREIADSLRHPSASLQSTICLPIDRIA
ncbi:hypothetical protein G6F40_015846 [Rhizopus arrhizus]|nr:hypothetical protein G6F40_015846 [Rhizopus arrhizus]